MDVENMSADWKCAAAAVAAFAIFAGGCGPRTEAAKAPELTVVHVARTSNPCSATAMPAAASTRV